MSYDRIRRKLITAFVGMNDELSTDFEGNVRAAVWDWDRVTTRKSGDVVGSPRDIVDTGQLVNSQTPPRPISDTRIMHEWQADHAGTVRVGYVTDQGTIVPGRDWIGLAFDDIPLGVRFKNEYPDR